MEPASAPPALPPPLDGGSPRSDVTLGLTLDAARTQKVGRLKVHLGCGATACDVTLGGKAVARKAGRKRKQRASGAKKVAKRFDVETKTLSIGAGKTKTRRVRFKDNRRSVRALRKLLRLKTYRARAKAAIEVTAADAAGSTDMERVTVKLKR